MLATDYPLLDAFWTMLWIFGFIIWIWLLFVIFADIFRSRELSGWSKAFWVAFVIFLPLIGVLAYLIARGSKMHEHAVEAQQQQQAMFADQVRSVTGNGGGGPGSELSKLADLRDRGVISNEEFETAKAKLLGSQPV